MVFDIIVGLIIVFFMAYGIRKGFVYTFLTTVDWILALVAAFMWSSKLGEFLMEKTHIYTAIYDKIYAKFSASAARATEGIESLPSILGDAVSGAADKLTTQMAQTMADRIFAILCFILVVVLVKLAIFLIIRLLSKNKNDNVVIGFTDGLAGLAVGLVKGILIVFVLFAIMVPVMNMFFPDHVEAAMQALEKSHFAGELYNNNLLLLIVRDFIHIG